MLLGVGEGVNLVVFFVGEVEKRGRNREKWENGKLKKGRFWRILGRGVAEK